MLDVTKIEGDSLKLNKSQFALNDLLPAASRTRRATARTAMSVSCWILAKNEYVNADRQRISPVVANLLDNAAKFTKAGTVTLAAESDGG